VSILRGRRFKFRFHKAEDVLLIGKELSPAVQRTMSEAAAWCSYKQHSGKPLRSPELDPSAFFNLPDFPDSREAIDLWIKKKYESYSRATSWINETRSELIKAAGIETVGTVDALSKSKLLVYEPLETVDDGAAEATSLGFYDLHDAPPWDTWLLYADRTVFCCVLEFVISRAQDGIDANPVDCIRWSDWSKLAHIGI
jgi:hypothetical protein